MVTAPRIGVVGLGLIGGSIARLLRARGVTFVAWDPDPTTRSLARAGEIPARDDLEDLAEFAPELVIVAAPLRSMRDVFSALAPLVSPETTVVDVGSVKGPVREWAREAGLGRSYVGAHPMAGTERTGFAASSADLLERVTWAVTVDDATPRGHAERVLWLVLEVARSRALLLTDDDHDRAVALISHLPHVFAAQLLAQAEGSPLAGAARALAAGSFRDGTRVARGDSARSEAMVLANAPAVRAGLADAVADLRRLADDLERAARDADISWFFARQNAEAEDLGATATGAPSDADAGAVSDRIAWEQDWQGLATEAGRRGGAVVAFDDEGLTLL
ncbi:prephenate dehydrogenase/arogenate dehydrogenase family protein [Rarobacter faecitabidus]|uniref:Prephenate dehydrogenase n=1 Tax=Rarobacter faecitabidus TaxID=13243 RepID=A0A542ZUK2_RARFA|nr:prephenate dehydrogenase/arogenate dehydrogenase family protein [Rarobacter faecitabidus]TQL64038.1 prephenate dehydrogenase [Rarobacter faecitabidus]